MNPYKQLLALQERLAFIRMKKAMNINQWYKMEIYADELITLRQIRKLAGKN